METLDGECLGHNPCGSKRCCTKCGLVKGLGEFNQSRKVKSDGRVSVCRPCSKVIAAAYRSRPDVKANAAAYRAQRYRSDPAYRDALKRNARKPERRLQKRQYGAAYRSKNAAKIKAYNAEYTSRADAQEKRKRANHSHHLRRKAAGYPHRKNDKTRATRRKWEKQRRADPMWRLHFRISQRVRASLRDAKGGRRWQELLGYTAAELRAHLERQFEKGMSWSNMSDWHIDHIIPVSRFKFETADDADFKVCWSLSNLRPLWAADNLRKRDARLHLL